MEYILKFESFGGSIPDPEHMDVNEWDEEVTNAKEVEFTQREKELFIALSDTISLSNKINQPWIAWTSLEFTMVNGLIDSKLGPTTVIRTLSTYKNDDEYYYIAKWERGNVAENLYRCDGYECWEKFLKEIFTGYRKLINKGLNESLDDFGKTEALSIDSNEFNQVEKLVPLDDKEMRVFLKVCDVVGYKFLKKMDTSPMNPVVSIGTGPMADRVISVKKNDDEQYFIRIFNRSLEDYSLPDKGMTRYYRCDDRDTYLSFIDEVLTEFLEYFEDTRDNSRPGSYLD